jgi:hypothetical protein
MTVSLRITAGQLTELNPDKQLQILRRCAPLDDSGRGMEADLLRIISELPVIGQLSIVHSSL